VRKKQLLIAAEVQAVQTYWHMDPHATGETPYPEQGLRNLVTMGNVEDFQAGAWLYVTPSIPSHFSFASFFWS
jgi:endo-1,3(4)-beta-glucanase